MSDVTVRTTPAPIVSDLVFWVVASASALVTSGRLATTWGAPRSALVGVAAGIFVAGLAGLAARARLRGTAVLKAFGWANLAIVPALVALAVLDALGLTSAGNVALGCGAAVAAVFGVWQVASGTVTSQRRS